MFEAVEKISQASVLVIGDVMLDRFVYGDIQRISPEAPVPVLRYRETQSMLGGAGNVVRNLLAVGSGVFFIAVIGDDPEGREVSGILSGQSADRVCLIAEGSRRTTLKTRFIAGRQQVLRVDKETASEIAEKTRNSIIASAREFISRCDVILLSDYNKGVLTGECLSSIIRMAKESAKPVFIDPKGADYGRYHGASVLTPNIKELKEATRMPAEGDEGVAKAAQKILDQCALDAVLVTRGQEGMSLIEAGGSVKHFKAAAKEVFDVSGAGDTAIAIAAAARAAGASLPDAADLANLAAGIAVGKVGTAVVQKKELIQYLLHKETSQLESKIIDLETAKELVGKWKRKGQKVGFTNGFFDLLHPVHLHLLGRAAKACDRLMVGLNGDNSVRKIRGKDPIQNERARGAILASLENVDAVIIFQETTPVALIEELRPDVLIKGANYSPEEVVGGNIVKSYGGEIILVDVDEIGKENAIIAKITGGII